MTELQHFYSFLNQEEAYDNYVNDFILCYNRELLNYSITIDRLVSNSFSWHLSILGGDYYVKLNSKWLKYILDHNINSTILIFYHDMKKDLDNLKYLKALYDN